MANDATTNKRQRVLARELFTFAHQEGALLAAVQEALGVDARAVGQKPVEQLVSIGEASFALTFEARALSRLFRRLEDWMVVVGVAIVVVVVAVAGLALLFYIGQVQQLASLVERRCWHLGRGLVGEIGTLLEGIETFEHLAQREPMPTMFVDHRRCRWHWWW